MAGKDFETVQQELRGRFAAPLPEFYKRRIVFWYDPDREYEDLLDGLELDGVKLLRLNGRNTFAAKKLLCHDDTASNYLVYQPQSFERKDDDWMLNIELYSEPFHADRISTWIREMGLGDDPETRIIVRRYRKFFSAQAHRTAVAGMRRKLSRVTQLHIAVMAAICGCREPRYQDVLRTVLSAGMNAMENKVYNELVNFGADSTFKALTTQATGFVFDDDNLDFAALAAHILLTAVSRAMHRDNLAGLESLISVPHQSFCYDFTADWLHSGDAGALYNIAREVEYQMSLAEYFARFELDELTAVECFPCVNECILSSLLRDVEGDIVDVDLIKNTSVKRRAMAWYGGFECYYDGLVQIAEMQQFSLEHADGFHTVEPQKIWREYTEDYYRMDTYYRRFNISFRQSLQVSNPQLDDLFKAAADRAEGLYTHWFLDALNENWTNAAAENLEKYGYIPGIPQQTDFYVEKVRGCENRIYVIISDALRFEVAATLAEQLRRETQSKVSLSSCEALFPTITKFGMAALLPHRKLEAVEKAAGQLGVLADGVQTDAGYRDRILKNANVKSVALKYDNLVGMKRAERSALVKGMEVVYIYHDEIDAASHVSDSDVFPACGSAISEIKNIVRIIANEFGGTKIIITADHGFLYTRSPLSEDDKVDKSTPSEQDVEIDRRYLITEKGAKPEYLLPVKFLDEKYDAFAARECVRIKKKGGGLNFVHGGISLQEMVVPVIEYHYLRNDSLAYRRNKEKYDTKPVELQLLSSGRKLYNLIFSLNFFQREPVGDNRSAAVYRLYFVDNLGQQISDVCRVIADSNSPDHKQRVYRCGFNLKPRQYVSSESYFLVIADENDKKRIPTREEFQIEVSFADDFGFDL